MYISSTALKIPPPLHPKKKNWDQHDTQKYKLNFRGKSSNWLTNNKQTKSINYETFLWRKFPTNRFMGKKRLKSHNLDMR